MHALFCQVSFVVFWKDMQYLSLLHIICVGRRHLNHILLQIISFFFLFDFFPEGCSILSQLPSHCPLLFLWGTRVLSARQSGPACMFFQFVRWMERIAIPYRCCISAGFAHPAGRSSPAFRYSSSPLYSSICSPSIKSISWTKPQG